MAVFVILSIVLIFVIIVYLVQQSLRPNKYPPGPTWLPIVGNLFYIKSLIKEHCYQHAVFKHLDKMYNTRILGLKLGQDLTVVVSSFDLIRQVLTRQEFEGRPTSFFFRLRTFGRRQGITCTDGNMWHEQRTFAVRHLRKVGYGKESMEDAICAELSDLIANLDQNEKVRLAPAFAKRVLNVLWILVAGTRITQSCTDINKLLTLMDKRKLSFDLSGGKLSHTPWLRFVAPELSGYNLITEINTSLEDFIKEIIHEHEKSHKCDNIRDFIDGYLHHMHEEGGADQRKSFSVDQLTVVCLDFFIAGSQTTSSTLDFAFLVVLLHPEIQKKVRDEIWSVVGTERLPALSDRPNMPYVEAVLMETQRLHTIVTLIGPRRVLQNTTLGGYEIPKDTIVLLNVHRIHMDEGHWKDPHVFRPERFLDENGAVRSDEWFLPFGLGRRRCLGDALARSCIFLFFTGILQHYQVLPEDEKILPTLQPQPGITMSPQPYYVRLVRILHDKSKGA